MRKSFIMDGIYADEVQSMINVAKTVSPHFKAMDDREIVSVLMEMGLAAERSLHDTQKN